MKPGSSERDLAEETPACLEHASRASGNRIPMSKSDSTGLQTSGTPVEPQQNIALTETGLSAFIYEIDTEYHSRLGCEVPAAEELFGFVDVEDWTLSGTVSRLRRTRAPSKGDAGVYHRGLLR